MRRTVLATLAALTFAGSMTGCFGHDEYRDREGSRERAREIRQQEYRDREGRVYRHERWHDQDVYQREDGRWYSRRGDDWVIRADVDLH
jgi:hypothetical protein